MSELKEELKSSPAAAQDLPIDDMLDGSDIHQWPEQFGQVISYIHTSLYEDYLLHDMRAMRHQKLHRWASVIAIVSGTTAILLSLSGIFFQAKGIDFPKGFFDSLVLVTFLIAFIVSIIASRITHPHENWLLERFYAEEYRTRKFRALLQNSLFCSNEKPWSERFTLWKLWFDGDVREAKSTIKNSVQNRIEGETISPPSPDTSGCTFDEGYLQDLIKYYMSKRLETQICYFNKRAGELERQDNRFRLAFKLFFILGSVFVLFQLIINNTILKYYAVFQIMNIINLLVILSLPIFIFAARTLRSSTEVARSASLYRAKRNALMDFRNRLTTEIERGPHNWEAIIKILWDCENHLEAVNHEWFRIMKEAEWTV